MSADWGLAAIDLLAAALLALTLAMIGISYLRTSIRALTVHSLIVGLGTALVGVLAHRPHLFIIAALAVGLKALLVPAILRRAVRRTGARREPPPPFTVPGNYILASGVVVIAYMLTRPMPLEAAAGVELFVTRDALGAGIAIMLIGLLMMLLRSTVVGQVIGLLVLENGLFFAAVAATSGMPLIVELGVFFDVVIGVMVLTRLSFQISQTIESFDTRELNRLSEGPWRSDDEAGTGGDSEPGSEPGSGPEA